MGWGTTSSSPMSIAPIPDALFHPAITDRVGAFVVPSVYQCPLRPSLSSRATPIMWSSRPRFKTPRQTKFGEAGMWISAVPAGSVTPISKATAPTPKCIAKRIRARHPIVRDPHLIPAARLGMILPRPPPDGPPPCRQPDLPFTVSRFLTPKRASLFPSCLTHPLPPRERFVMTSISAKRSSCNPSPRLLRPTSLFKNIFWWAAPYRMPSVSPRIPILSGTK